MTDPVICTDGFTYERSSIETWFAKNKSSPMTGAHIETLTLIPNRALKQTIERYQQTLSGAPPSEKPKPKPKAQENSALIARMKAMQEEQQRKTEKLKEKLVFLSSDSRSRLVVTEEISAHIFQRILEFLYSGFCQISGPADFIEDTRKAADAFICNELSTICANIAEVFLPFFSCS